MNNNKLKKKVMARIYLEYTKDIVRRYPDYFMVMIFLATSFTLVSFKDVMSNISQTELTSVFNFLLIALKNTSFIIQLLIVGFVVRTIVGSVKLINKSLHPKLTLVKLKY
ncbi:MAG: hypothetical protein JW740_01205 [Candidatus Zambryskibacteria bacterium]|nr:hypothetical protein [Candidatus Zambryskibacteria bacterium]